MEGKALVVERFDRAAGARRIHMEDFAQVFGLFPDDKYAHRSYANLASVLWAETGERGAYEFVRRLVFSVLIGNGDMHLKNWSLLYPDGRTPVLSPTYDFAATVPYIPGDKLALNFGGSRSLNEITVDQVRRFADQARLPAGDGPSVPSCPARRRTMGWRACLRRVSRRVRRQTIRLAQSPMRTVWPVTKNSRAALPTAARQRVARAQSMALA